MVREFPTVTFERFADDAVVHCVTERQARQVRAAIAERMAEVGLRAASRQDQDRVLQGREAAWRLRTRRRSRSWGTRSVPARRATRTARTLHGRSCPRSAPRNLTKISREVRPWRLHRRTHDTEVLAREVNPIVRGWMNYYAEFYPSAVSPSAAHGRHLMRWARKKYKRLEHSDRRAKAWLSGVRKRAPDLFVHWCVALHGLKTGRQEPDESRGCAASLGAGSPLQGAEVREEVTSGPPALPGRESARGQQHGGKAWSIAEASKVLPRKARVIWRRPDCLKPSLQRCKRHTL